MKNISIEKALRRKFIMVSIGAVAFVLTVLAVVINVYNYWRVSNTVNSALETLSQGNTEQGDWLDNYNDGISVLSKYYASKYFVVNVDAYGNIVSLLTENVALITVDEAVIIATAAIEAGDTEGRLYGFNYMSVDSEYGQSIYFVDTAQEYAICSSVLTTSIVVCLAVLGAISILLIAFADKVVAPIAKSHNKQKQFVTNITHEFKTPLAIIKANTEVAEMTGDKTQWTVSTHHQVERLNKLINNLVYLAKQEEGDEVVKCQEVLSQLVSDTAEPFTALASSQGKNLQLDIQPDINMLCEQQSMCTLVSILLENSIKYSTPDSHIKLSLAKVKDKVLLSCSNTAKGLIVGKYDQWLDRFYRQDSARSNNSSNSFGIGLSTAKAIAVNHDAHISAYSDDGIVVNIVITFNKV